MVAATWQIHAQLKSVSLCLYRPNPHYSYDQINSTALRIPILKPRFLPTWLLMREHQVILIFHPLLSLAPYGCSIFIQVQEVFSSDQKEDTKIDIKHTKQDKHYAIKKFPVLNIGYYQLVVGIQNNVCNLEHSYNKQAGRQKYIQKLTLMYMCFSLDNGY